MGILDNLKNVLGGRKSSDSPISSSTVRLQDEAGTRIHTVQSGETLWRIAAHYYEDGDRYLEIFDANTELLASPDHIEPGQQLVIP